MAKLVAYPQLEARTHALLAARVATVGTKAGVAGELGVTRTAVSQALAGKYPADTRRLAVKILERYADGIACPHLKRDLPPTECRSLRERPLPTSPLAAVKHWQACRHCRNNPRNTP